MSSTIQTSSSTEEGFLLSHLVNQGDIPAVQALLSEGSALGIDVNTDLNPSGETALFVAIRRNLPAMVELLLRFEADPNIATDERCGKQTPLHLAAEFDQCTSMTMLLQFGANPNTVDAQKQTALHIAARMGHAASARILIAHGTNLLAEDLLGRSALRLAETSAKCSTAHAEIAKLLLASITDAYGNAFVEENNLKVDDVAIAQAGGPIQMLMGGNSGGGGASSAGGGSSSSSATANVSLKISGVPIQSSHLFMQQARQIDSSNIAWVTSSTISGAGKKKGGKR